MMVQVYRCAEIGQPVAMVFYSEDASEVGLFSERQNRLTIELGRGFSHCKSFDELLANLWSELGECSKRFSYRLGGYRQLSGRGVWFSSRAKIPWHGRGVATAFDVGSPVLALGSNPQQVFPCAKVAVESEALRDFRAWENLLRIFVVRLVMSQEPLFESELEDRGCFHRSKIHNSDRVSA
jgi:hypothetical protein